MPAVADDLQAHREKLRQQPRPKPHGQCKKQTHSLHSYCYIF